MKSKFVKFFVPIFLTILILFTSCVFISDDLLNYLDDYLLILNSTGNVVLVYNLNKNSFNDNPINVGPGENTNYSPQQIIKSPDANYLYIINSMDNSVTKFSKNMSYIKKYELPAGTNPYNGFIEGNYMYITGLVSAKVLRLNLNDNTYIQSEQLYSQNAGIQAIASLNSSYLIVVNTNFNSNTFSYEDGIIYILSKNDLTKVKEFTLNQSFIGLTLKNFQQIFVHQESDGIYCDLFATGSYGFANDSGFLRIKIVISGSDFTITKVCSDILDSGEYFGSVSTAYDNYLYFVSNKALYRVLISKNSVSFSNGIEKNANISNKQNLAIVYVDKLSDGLPYITIVDTPWGNPSSFSILKLENFATLNFSNFIEFPGYPVSIIYKSNYIE